jgi:hypothetical protein
VPPLPLITVPSSPPRRRLTATSRAVVVDVPLLPELDQHPVRAALDLVPAVRNEKTTEPRTAASARSTRRASATPDPDGAMPEPSTRIVGAIYVAR